MISVSPAKDNEGTEWNNFVRSQPGCHHSWAWEWRGILSEVFGHEPIFLVARPSTGLGASPICGVAPLFHVKSPLFGSALISTPYLNGGGIIASSGSAFSALLQEIEKLAKERSCNYVELRHREASPEFPAEYPVRSHKLALVLSLKKDPDELFQTFPAKLRSQVRRPTKSGVSAQTRGPEPAAIDDFYEVFAGNMRDLGTPVYPRKLFAVTAKAFGSALRVITVHHEKDVIAAGVTIGFGAAAEIPWASSLRKFNSLSGNMLLYWDSMKQACLDGYETFDFGRSSPESGTHRFKLQWGPKEVPLHWYYIAAQDAVPDVNPHSPKFKMLVECWKRLPLPVANTIGPWLTRGLP